MTLKHNCWSIYDIHFILSFALYSVVHRGLKSLCFVILSFLSTFSFVCRTQIEQSTFWPRSVPSESSHEGVERLCITKCGTSAIIDGCIQSSLLITTRNCSHVCLLWSDVALFHQFKFHCPVHVALGCMNYYVNFLFNPTSVPVCVIKAKCNDNTSCNINSKCNENEAIRKM